MCRAILKPSDQERRETSYKRYLHQPLASFVTVASTNERNVPACTRWQFAPSCSAHGQYFGQVRSWPIVVGIAAFPGFLHGTWQQVENRRNAQLTPAALGGFPCVRFPPRSLCGGEDCVC